MGPGMDTFPERPVSSAFSRLAVAHAFSLAGEACVTVALAGTLFFTVPANDARPKVALYLLLTIAPFAFVGPFIGPAIDRARGGRRVALAVSGFGRAVLCLYMAQHINSLFLYPEAFGVLVLSKGYAVAKSALVPSVVHDEHTLVEANSRLSLIGGLVGICAGLPAAGILHLGGASWVLVIGAVLNVLMGLASLRIPVAREAEAPLGAEEVHALHSASVLLASSAIALLRGMVGFLTFLLAFALKQAGEPSWFFGLTIMWGALGGMAGALVAPMLRRRMHEEWMLALALTVPAIVAIFGARAYGRPAVLAVSAALGIGASAGKLAFDSLVQRDAPAAMRGRSFARFETQLQLAWVLGAALPVVLSLSPRLGYYVLAAALGAGGPLYFAMTRSAQHPAK